MSKLSVLYETMFWDPADGWQIASRAYAKAMEMADLDVSLVSPIPWVGEPDPEVVAEVGHMAKMPENWDLYVHSGACAGPDLMWRPLRMLARGARPPRVYFTMIERQGVAAQTAQWISQLDGLWVPCKANVEAFSRSGIPSQKIGYAPFPFFNDDPYLGLFGLNRAPGVPRFYWIGRWEPRKAPDSLVRGFLRAFKPGQARLTLKIGSAPFSAPNFPVGPDVVAVDEIYSNANVAAQGWTAQNYQESIQVIRGRLPETQMIKLHADNDIYVSCSRGEGIDLPAYRAKLAGNRVVATYSGGPEDFLGEDDIRVTMKGYTTANPAYAWEADAQYGDYEVDSLAEALQRAAKGPLVLQERDWPIDSFRARNVAVKLRRLVEKAIDEAKK